MPDCRRCGGLWIERQEESYCVNCGARTLEGHQFCSVGETLNDQWAHKRRARHGFEIKKRKPQAMDTNKKITGRPVGSRNKFKDTHPESQKEKLIDIPKTMPIEEHPYMLFLAQLWEDLDQEMEPFRKKQEAVKKQADEFRNNYPVQD